MLIRPLARAAVLAVTAVAGSVLLTTSAHAAPDLDCADFPDQAAAQVVFDADPRDPNRLDEDGDRQACENHDYGTAGPADQPVSDDPVSDDGNSGDQVRVPVGAVEAGDGSGSASDAPVGLLTGVVGAAAVAAAAGQVRRSRAARR